MTWEPSGWLGHLSNRKMLIGDKRIINCYGNRAYYVARFAGSGVFLSAYPQLALWATYMIASFAGLVPSGLIPNLTHRFRAGLHCSALRACLLIVSCAIRIFPA